MAMRLFFCSWLSSPRSHNIKMGSHLSMIMMMVMMVNLLSSGCSGEEVSFYIFPNPAEGTC